MALLRRFFNQKPPPKGLLEITERVYVFESCFSTDVLEDDLYRAHMQNMVTQIREQLSDSSFLVFNFREGERKSQLMEILSQYDMTVMDYPRQYEGCPILAFEMIHHFLHSCDSWISLDSRRNVVLLHCERGGWPTLAFMLAGFLIYRKLYTGEQKTLDLLQREAPKGLLRLLTPLNPMPSQIRYLQYISERNVASEWPPPGQTLTLDCIVLRAVPSFDAEGGCRPIVRVYGLDPHDKGDRTTRVLLNTGKKKKVRYRRQADCDVLKMDIHCGVQGDVVLECVHVNADFSREEMMFRVMFNTAFMRSNILMLGKDDIDVLWDAKERFAKDFRAEVLFADSDSSGSGKFQVSLQGDDKKGALAKEDITRVQDLINTIDWTEGERDAASVVLQKIASPTGILESGRVEPNEQVTRVNNEGNREQDGQKCSRSDALEQQAFQSRVSSNAPLMPMHLVPEAPTLPQPSPKTSAFPAPLPSSLAAASAEKIASLPTPSIAPPAPPPLSKSNAPLSPPPSSELGKDLAGTEAPKTTPARSLISESKSNASPSPPPPLALGVKEPPSLGTDAPSTAPLSVAKNQPPSVGTDAPSTATLPLAKNPSQVSPPPGTRGPPAAPPLPGAKGPPAAPPPPGAKFPGPPPPPPPGGRAKPAGAPSPPGPPSQSLRSTPAVSAVLAAKKASFKPFHWVKVTRAIQGSLWAEGEHSNGISRRRSIDMSELESLFSAAVSANGTARPLERPAKLEKIHLIEMQRAKNCEIMLTKVKMPLPDVASAILALNGSILDVDQVGNLLKFCPTKEESETLKGYNGDKDKLGKCEQFFLEMMKVPRVDSKLRVFLFKLQFAIQVGDLQKDLNIVNSASKEVRESLKLREIMHTILLIGNALNRGTARGSAIGFKLDSLLKLNDMRAKDNKTTLMHYLVKVLSDSPDLLEFHKDLTHVEEASKVQLKFLAEEMQAINKNLEKVQQELEESENDGSVSTCFQENLKSFLDMAEADVRLLTRLYSEVGRNADELAQYFGEDPARCPFEQVVSVLLNFVVTFKRAQEENCQAAEIERKKAEREAELKHSLSKKKSSVKRGPEGGELAFKINKVAEAFIK